MRSAAWLMTLLMVALIGACSSRTVPMPSDDAPPEAVVRAYVETLEARDCDTARKLFAPNRVGDGRIGEGWCGHIVISNLEVHESNPHRAVGYTDMTTGWEQAWAVVAWLDVKGGDISLRDGRYPMTFLLVRGADGEPWRLVAFGMG